MIETERRRAALAESRLANLTAKIQRLDRKLHEKAMELHREAIEARADQSVEGSIWEEAWGHVHDLLTD